MAAWGDPPGRSAGTGSAAERNHQSACQTGMVVQSIAAGRDDGARGVEVLAVVYRDVLFFLLERPGQVGWPLHQKRWQRKWCWRARSFSGRGWGLVRERGFER